MSSSEIPRRDLVAGLAAATGLAALPSCGSEPSGAQGTQAMTQSSSPDRLPVAFLPHGGGPWPFVEMAFGTDSEKTELSDYLKSVRSLPKVAPRAVLVISAHWEEKVPTVMTSAAPPMLYDYYGFPAESYAIQWPAPGAPEVAERVRALLEGAGFQTGTDARRGFDHGTFVPLKLTYPDADVPTLQLSLVEGLDPAQHLAIGRALAPLRDEGVFIVGSGMTFHNLRGFRNASSVAVAETFDTWLREAATRPATERDQALTEWSRAPMAREAHPREEHLLPLMVIAGAAGADAGTLAYSGTFAKMRLSAYHFG